MATLPEKIEVLRIADFNQLEVTFGDRGTISVNKWNRSKGKFDWIILHLPNSPIDELFNELNEKLNG